MRYWESEFRIISPERSRSKQRLYTRKDLDMILEIKKLLYKERYTIEGAKKRLLNKEKALPKPIGMGFKEEKQKRVLLEIRDEVKALKRILR